MVATYNNAKAIQKRSFLNWQFCMPMRVYLYDENIYCTYCIAAVFEANFQFAVQPNLGVIDKFEDWSFPSWSLADSIFKHIQFPFQSVVTYTIIVN